MTSLEIADLTEKDHKNVMRDIRVMFVALGVDGLRFERIYRDAANREKPCFKLSYDETMTLITGYSIPLRAAVVRRWRELEHAQPALPDFSAARAWADAGWSERPRVPLSCA
jgi:phage regulator Rha-like protein